MTGKDEKVKPSAISAGDESGHTFSSLVDIYEEPDGTTVLVMEMPGASRENVDINVDKGVLAISGDGSREPVLEKCDCIYSGFDTGEYFRAFALSDEVDRDSIEAQMQNGVLVLRLPKASKAATKKIEIK